MKTTPEALQTTVGQRVDLIDTPALVVDLDAMDRNIQRMADFARKHQVRWRPHAKMHKSAELALLMQRAGAQGVCVQKVAEAEALAAGGVNDITITNQVIAMPKLHRVARLAAQLAARGGRLGVAVDHADGIARLAEAMAQSGSDAGIDVLYRLATRQDIQAPRTWQLANAAINRLLWTPDGLTLVGWADTQHLDQIVLRDENHA